MNSQPDHHAADEDDDLLTAAERNEEPPELEAEDEAELAAMESFPASDPPSYTPSRAGPVNKAPVPAKDVDNEKK